jgi:cyclopropane fatty-acyl-phospholipid synthase-like methyltransferase
LLDIGCGWGALHTRAAEVGRRRSVLRKQFELAASGWPTQDWLAGEIRLQDYRDIDEPDGQLDKIGKLGGHVRACGLNHPPTTSPKIHAC